MDFNRRHSTTGRVCYAIQRIRENRLMVSEIGLGAEWLERHNTSEVKAVIDCCESFGSIF